MSSSGSARPAALLAIGVVLVLVVVGVVFSMPRPIRQPLAFNHSLHINDVGAECTDCHLYVETTMHATIPNITVCADCHEEALTDSPQEAWLVEQIQSGTRIPWRKLYRLPDHVFFSHRRHTAVGEVECTTCHGDMSARTEPPGRPLVPLSMDRCITCHEKVGASNDCISCHR